MHNNVTPNQQYLFCLLQYVPTNVNTGRRDAGEKLFTSPEIKPVRKSNNYFAFKLLWSMDMLYVLAYIPEAKSRTYKHNITFSAFCYQRVFGDENMYCDSLKLLSFLFVLLVSGFEIVFISFRSERYNVMEQKVFYLCFLCLLERMKINIGVYLY